MLANSSFPFINTAATKRYSKNTKSASARATMNLYSCNSKVSSIKYASAGITAEIIQAGIDTRYFLSISNTLNTSTDAITARIDSDIENTGVSDRSNTAKSTAAINTEVITLVFI